MFPLIALLCSTKGLLQKASPWGEAVATATDEGGSICTSYRMYLSPNRNDPRVVPVRSSTNFLPFLSGSGESENVRISLAECGSEQPEFAARNTATPKFAQHKERDINPIELKFLRSRGFFQEAPCGFGQSPRSSPTKYGGFVKKDREVLTEGTRFDIMK